MPFQSSNADSVSWAYYDRKLLHPLLKRRKLIGRVEVDDAAASHWAVEHLGMTLIELSDLMLSAFRWLTSEAEPLPIVWRAWQTQNHCLYFTPTAQDRRRLHRCDRHFDEILTADAAGLCATELAIDVHVSKFALFSASASSGRRLKQRLADYRHMHPEGPQISTVLD